MVRISNVSTWPADLARSYSSIGVGVLQNGTNFKDSTWPADPALFFSSKSGFFLWFDLARGPGTVLLLGSRKECSKMVRVSRIRPGPRTQHGGMLENGESFKDSTQPADPILKDSTPSADPTRKNALTC